ncbi:hypothetical protein [Niastella populi]|uniref:Uncharacterized protein n=1 Tax=Niastella populi TaxID=550983 RepID=A0A1V9FDK2_9BACT|nr:hypothetical protein [Niastella populi]OQP56454.1 hypothetical protein A4R26_04650 [Niastella populi]
MYDKPSRYQNTKGLNLISIKLSEIGSYFHFQQPLIAAWWDNSPTVVKLLSVLPNNQEYRDEVRQRLISNLNEDYTNRLPELKAIVDPLLQLFPAGEYSLQFHTTSWKKPTETDYIFNDWELAFANPIDVQLQELKLKEYLEFLAENKRHQWHNIAKLWRQTTYSFYDGFEFSFVATMPASGIKEERVKYFEEQITKGDRPFAIVFNCHYEQKVTSENGNIYDRSLFSDNFIIDGHHKLKAYYNLKMFPRFVTITHYPTTREEIKFNIEDLIEVLYPWHIEYILRNWHQKEQYIQPYLEKKNSKIHAFIR